MDLEEIQPLTFVTFLRVSELGSITAASKELGVSQSAVSQCIDKLEKRFGTPVFNREVRPIQLTKAGKQLLPAAKRFIEESTIFRDSINAISEDKIRSVSIGFSEVSSFFFSEEVEACLVPQLESLEVKWGLIPQILDDFDNGLVDIAVAPDIPLRPGVERRLLIEEDYFVVCSKKIESDLNQFFRFDVFKENGLPFISYRSNSADRKRGQQLLRRLGRNSAVNYEFENTFSLLRAVENGLGWTILPPLNILFARSLSSLSVLKIEGFEMTKKLYVGSSRPQLRYLISEIEQLFKDKINSHTLRRRLQELPLLVSGMRVKTETENFNDRFD